MFKITSFKDDYLLQLKEIDFMMWLRVQWDTTIVRENVFAAIDENNQLLGICALSYDGTWYYIDKSRTDIPKYRMQMEVCVKEDICDTYTVKRELINKAKNHLLELKKQYPNLNLCIRCWCEEKEYKKQQQLLEQGFVCNNLVWIMGFNLEDTKIIDAEENELVSFEVLNRSDDALKEYFVANELGFDNVQDAEGELRFRLGDERTEILVSRQQDRIVSSVTIWHISDERAATENIFTIPEFRRKGMGIYTISKSLKYLKEKGYKIATLTCVGDNANAIALYNKIGYKVMGHLLEMHFEL